MQLLYIYICTYLFSNIAIGTGVMLKKQYSGIRYYITKVPKISLHVTFSSITCS